MTDPADLSPEELDRLACEAVGIEPEIWVWPIRTESGNRHEYRPAYWRGEPQNWRDTFDADPEEVEVFPPVSSDPAACAMLKAAMSEAGLPMLLIFYGEDVLAMLCDATTEWHRGALELIATAEIRTRAETEERAVALAVMAWAQAKGSSQMGRTARKLPRLVLAMVRGLMRTSRG